MPERLTQDQPKATPGQVYYQRYSVVPVASWGPLTTARIVSWLCEGMSLLWAVTHPQNRSEVVLYAKKRGSDDAPTVEVKFPHMNSLQGNWLHVSSADHATCHQVFDAVLKIIETTSKEVEEDTPL